jgi:predicted amidophosphoribosyltransferase
MASLIAHHGGRLWRAIVDTVTPPHCLMCHVPIAAPSALCVACWQSLRPIEEPVCEVLGTPFALDPGPGAVSAAAQAAPPDWDRARAAVAYDEASRQLVHALKYRDTQEAGYLMSRMMARAGRKLLADANMIVPVPLHRRRLWQRRFNQSAFLAQQLAAPTPARYRPDLLLRVAPTRPQVGLQEGERRENVKRAFAADPRRREGSAPATGVRRRCRSLRSPPNPRRRA